MSIKTYALVSPNGMVVTFQTETELPIGAGEIELVGVASDGGGVTTNGGGGPGAVDD